MSNNQIAKTELLPINEIMSIGKAFAESGMFADIKSAAQAVVKIQAGQEMGIPPFASMSGIHIIQGKPTVGAGIMASRVKSSGKYDYKVVEQSETKCSIDFYQGREKLGNSTFTIEDAKKAGTKNLDKFPKNMLFARAISNGQRWYCPDVFTTAVYTPEEMANDSAPTVDVPHEVIPEQQDIDLVVWGEQIEACTTITELTNFYKANKSVIDNNEDIKNIMSIKKQHLQVEKQAA